MSETNKNTIQTNNKQEALINKSELARLTGYSHATVCKWVQNKTVPYYKLGSAVRFKYSEIIEVFEQNKVETKG